MAIKFKNRIMFIKDTTSNEEICCWYFHGGGKKLAEVCCTSIVYTTEKKQTKVNFDMQLDMQIRYAMQSKNSCATLNFI